MNKLKLTLARIKLNANLLLRVDRHADRYGDRLVRLRVTAYDWQKGMHFAGEEHVTLPASSLSDVIEALERARAALEPQRPSQSQVSRQQPVRRDDETKQALRAQALELHAAGAKADTIAAKLGIGRATVYRWLENAPAPRPSAGVAESGGSGEGEQATEPAQGEH